EKLDALRDTEFRALYLEYDAAFEWSTDDPRLEALADRTARWLASRRGSRGGGVRSARDRAAARLGTTGVSAWSPAWDRLSEPARQRPARGRGLDPAML